MRRALKYEIAKTEVKKVVSRQNIGPMQLLILVRYEGIRKRYLPTCKIEIDLDI